MPIVAPVNVLDDVGVNVVGDANPGSVDFCQLVIVPVYPVNVSVAGGVLLVILWLDETVPPTALGGKLKVMVLITLLQPELAVAVNDKYTEPADISAAVGM